MRAAMLSVKQLQALRYAAGSQGGITYSEFPVNIGERTVRALAERGLLRVEITITDRGREAVKPK